MISFGFNGVEAGHNASFEYCYNVPLTVDVHAIYTGTGPFDVTYTLDGGTPITVNDISVDGVLALDQILSVGDHTITVTNITDANGCQASSEFLSLCTAAIHINDLPMISFGFNGVEAGHNASFEYCYNVPLTVDVHAIYTGTGPFDVTYTLDGGTPITVNDISVDGVLALDQILSVGDHTITVTNITDANGCQASSEFLSLCTAAIHINDLPMISFGFNGVEAGHNASFEYCYNVPLTVDVHAIYTGTGPFDVTYTLDGGTPITVNDISVDGVLALDQILSVGDHTITVTNITDANGCQASSEFLSLCTAAIHINDLPMISFGFNGVEAGHNASFEYCYNVPLTVDVHAIYTGTGPFDVTYTLDGGTPITVNDISVDGVLALDQILSVGDHTITVTNITDANGCQASSEFLSLCTAAIHINDLPMISFGFNGVEAGHNASFEYCYNVPLTVDVHAIYTGTGPFDVTYTLDGGTPITVNDISVDGVLALDQILSVGDHTITVTNITDANGCQASSEFISWCTAAIHINDLPMISFGVDGVEASYPIGTYTYTYCYDFPVQVITLYHDYAGKPPYSITYNINGDSPVTKNNLRSDSIIISRIFTPGTYIITITDIVDSNGCHSSADFLEGCVATLQINPDIEPPVISTCPEYREYTTTCDTLDVESPAFHQHNYCLVC
jgi:uncharacterized protein (UPF0303 family)